MEELKSADLQLRKLVDGLENCNECTRATILTSKLNVLTPLLNKIVSLLAHEQLYFKKCNNLDCAMSVCNCISCIWNTCLALVEHITLADVVLPLIQIIYYFYHLFEDAIVARSIQNKTFDEHFGLYCQYKRLCTHTLQYMERVLHGLFPSKKLTQTKIERRICKYIGCIYGRAMIVLDSLYKCIMDMYNMPKDGIKIHDSFTGSMMKCVIKEEYYIACATDEINIDGIMSLYSEHDLLCCISKGFLLGVLELENCVELLLESIEYQTLITKYHQQHANAIRSNAGFSLDSLLLRFNKSELDIILQTIVSNTNYYDFSSVTKMANKFEKYIRFVVDKRDIFTPFINPPFNCQFLIDAFQLCRHADHSFALIKLLGLVYTIIPTLPSTSRISLINYLIRDSFHFFFTHWSDVLREHYHYFLLYRSTLGWVRNIYNNKLTKQEAAIYQQRETPTYDPLKEDLKIITVIRENSKALEESIVNFPAPESLRIQKSSTKFKELSRESYQWSTPKRKLKDVPQLLFPFPSYEKTGLD